MGDLVPRFDIVAVFAGLLAYGFSLLGGVALIFLFFKSNLRLMRGRNQGKSSVSAKTALAQIFRWDRIASELPPSAAPGIALGAATLSQAFLLRHGIFPVMSVIRDLLLSRPSAPAVVRALVQCTFLLAIISALSVLSVWIAAGLFTRMTGDLDERAEIMSGNVSVAIFFALVLFGITLILNEGIEDVSRALIPYGRAGVIRLP